MEEKRPNKVASITIEYAVDCGGLIGDKYEYDPYICYHTSFGSQRVKETDTLVVAEMTPVPTLGARRTNLGEEKPADTKEKKKKTDEEKEEKIYMSLLTELPHYKSSKPIRIELADVEDMKGDDMIKFKLFSHTRYSGVPSIDKSESPYRERQIQSGTCNLELNDLFKYYREAVSGLPGPRKAVSFDVSNKFIDQKIIDEKARQLLNKNRNPTEAQINEALERAKPLTEKASILFTVTVHNFDEALFNRSIFAVEDLTTNGLHSMLPLEASSSFSRPPRSSSKRAKKMMDNDGDGGGTHYHSILFNSEKSWHIWTLAMNNLLGEYCNYFMKDEETGTDCLYQPCDEAISNLQLPIYASEEGKMPVYAYWSNHDPFFREYASEKTRQKELKLYGFDARTETYFLMMLRSSLRRFVIDEADFIAEINAHFSPSNTSTCPTANFLRIEEAVADIGTSVANSADYTADFRFMPEVTELDDHHHTIAELRHCSKCHKVMKKDEGRLRMRVLSLDSWDNVILNNTSSCDDCEGQDNTATTALRAYAIGRYDLGMNWESEALRAVRKLLQHSTISDVGALVTSAFMDTNNKKIESRPEELALIGSEMDKNSQNDGHCFALMTSRSHTIDMLDAGNTDKEIIGKLKEANKIGGTKKEEETFQMRDKKRKMLVLEPTGSIDARLLSLEESYANGENCYDPEGRLFLKKKAEFYFMKQVRLRLKEKEYKDSGIIELFQGEGLPFYVEKQVPQRRVSTFYNSIVHGSSIELMKIDPTLSQFAFCKDNKYGVRVGELIRGSPKSNLSLVCPYAHYQEKWQTEIVSMVESIQNQLPIMKYGRYSDKEYAEDIYSRFISPSDISASFNFRGLKNEKPDAATQKKQAKFEAVLKKASALSSNLTVVRFFSRVWKLNQDVLKTETLNRFIRELPGVIDYAYYVEKYVPVCEPVIEILILIDIEKHRVEPK